MVFVPAPLFCGSSTAKMADYPHNISHFTDCESRMKNPHNPGVDSAPANPLFITTLLARGRRRSLPDGAAFIRPTEYVGPTRTPPPASFKLPEPTPLQCERRR